MLIRDVGRFLSGLMSANLAIVLQVPSLQRLSTIAGELGLDFEKDELAEYRGVFHKSKLETNYSLLLSLFCFFLDIVMEN